MKIAITADIHHEPALRAGCAKKTEEGKFTNKATIQKLASEAILLAPDLFIAAGDIGESLEGAQWFRDTLETIAGYHPNFAAVLGNHDIWTPGAPTSLELFETILPQIMEDVRVHDLEKDNLVQDGVAVIGSYLHYDYSSQDFEGLAIDSIRNKFSHLSDIEFMSRFWRSREDFPDLTPDEYYERYKGPVNKDDLFLIGLPSDIEFARQIGKGFRKRLQAAEDDPDIHSIVIVTHVPCMPSQITRHPYNLGWSLGTPYFGNLSHSDFILELTKVRHIVSGHTHNRTDSMVIFNDGHEVQVQVLEAEYGSPTFVIIEV